MKNCFFALLVFCIQPGSAQSIEKKSYPVYINYPDYSIKAIVLNDGKKIAAKEELTYSWHAHNKIMETKGGYDGKLLDGDYTAFYLSNAIKEKGAFNKGLKNGKWIS